MQTFWIVMIVATILISLALIAFFIWRYFDNKKTLPQPKPPGPQPQPSDPTTINYGDVITLVSRLNNIPLSTCGSGYGCASFNVTLSPNTTLSSQQWRISNQQNSSSKGPVYYGDQVILTSLYIPGSVNLASCGGTSDGCGINVVAGRTSFDGPSQTWVITGGITGAKVVPNDIIQLRNVYATGRGGDVLYACGSYESNSTCGINVSLGTNNTTPQPQSKLWKITK